MTPHGYADPSSPPALSTARQERLTQQAVLMEVLDLHPVHKTVPELIRQLARDPHDVIEADEIERAVASLAAAGLLHHHDYRRQPEWPVTPTQAAFVAQALLLGEAEGPDA